jgi:hypothetical protein
LYSEKNKYKKLFYSTSLPSGYITKQLLEKYVIAISSTMIRAKFLKKNLFNSMYEIIGDFDFFIKSSIYNKILCIQKPLLFMRIHKKNFSLTRRDLHIYELNNWLNDYCKLLQKNGISFRYQKLYLYKLKLKNFINIFFKVNI